MKRDRFSHGSVFGPAPRVFEALWPPNLDFSESERTLTVSDERDFTKKEAAARIRIAIK